MEDAAVVFDQAPADPKVCGDKGELVSNDTWQCHWCKKVLRWGEVCERCRDKVVDHEPGRMDTDDAQVVQPRRLMHMAAGTVAQHLSPEVLDFFRAMECTDQVINDLRDGLTPKQQLDFLGEYKAWHTGGRLKVSITNEHYIWWNRDGTVRGHKVYDDNRRLSGEYKYFWANGLPRMICCYDNGLPHGSCIEWDRDGNVEWEAQFAHGRRLKCEQKKKRVTGK